MITLCQTDDIPDDSAKGFQLNGHALFVINKEGQFYAYQNNCPHLNIPLEFTPHQFLDSENTFIQCANHGALFEIATGLCISGPCSGESLTPIDISVSNGVISINENVVK